MTKDERRLWYDFLRELPIRFHRQKVIGDYIIDFYCASKKLAIELDGSQHYDDKKQVESDRQRDLYLANLGITVLRYSNLDVNKSFDIVCQDIYNKSGFSPD